jgi:hypothetical protein
LAVEGALFIKLEYKKYLTREVEVVEGLFVKIGN